MPGGVPVWLHVILFIIVLTFTCISIHFVGRQSRRWLLPLIVHYRMDKHKDLQTVLVHPSIMWMQPYLAHVFIYLCYNTSIVDDFHIKLLSASHMRKEVSLLGPPWLCCWPWLDNMARFDSNEKNIDIAWPILSALVFMSPRREILGSLRRDQWSLA